MQNVKNILHGTIGIHPSTQYYFEKHFTEVRKARNGRKVAGYFILSILMNTQVLKNPT